METARALDAKGSPLEEGTWVRVVALPEDALSGLTGEEAEDVGEAVGSRGEVDEVVGDVVSVLLISRRGRYHFVSFKGAMLEAVE